MVPHMIPYKGILFVANVGIASCFVFFFNNLLLLKPFFWVPRSTFYIFFKLCQQNAVKQTKPLFLLFW